MEASETVETGGRLRLLAIALCLVACGDDSTPAVDAGTDSATRDVGIDAATDAGSDAAVDAEADAARDANEGCQRISAGTWELDFADDVSISYSAATTPSLGTQPLVILFERIGGDPEVGSFDYGMGTDNENFGSCSQCTYIPIDPMRAFYADRGSIEVRRDPYDHILDVSVTNLRLIEVEVDETRSSTPIEGGDCVEVDDFSVTARLPPEAWVCDAEDWFDGEGCHCECGAPDPDCGGRMCPPFDPGCTPIEAQPLVNCAAGAICAFDPTTFATRCTEGCDWIAREGCEEGACLFDSAGGADTCTLPDDPRIDAALVGEPCGVDPVLQKFCGVREGFVEGYCDLRNNCARICEEDSECASDERCKRFLGTDGLGYCSEFCETDADCDVDGETCFDTAGLTPPFFCEPEDG